MDILVHLSEREGLPRALPQALAAGRPVVAFDCDGAREVCRDGETGFLVRPGHLHGLTERLLLLARDPKLRAELAARGREFVRANFAVEQMIDEPPPSLLETGRRPRPCRQRDFSLQPLPRRLRQRASSPRCSLCRSGAAGVCTSAWWMIRAIARSTRQPSRSPAASPC